MNHDDVGKYFTLDGEDIWECIAFCEYPTATMKNLKNGRETGGATCSPNITQFKKLVQEDK